MSETKAGTPVPDLARESAEECVSSFDLLLPAVRWHARRALIVDALARHLAAAEQARAERISEVRGFIASVLHEEAPRQLSAASIADLKEALRLLGEPKEEA